MQKGFNIFIFFAITFLFCGIAAATTYSEAVKQNIKEKSYHTTAGIACADCHGTVKNKTVMKAVETSTCRTCHDSFSKEYELDNGSYNPHMSIHYEATSVDCKLCHKEHAPSRNFCTACHADGLGFILP